jgi:hypothetical protein
MQEAPGDEQTQKKRKFVHLTTEQFSVLVQCFQQQQKDIGLLLHRQPTVSPSPSHDTSQINMGTSTDHRPSSNNAKAPEYYISAKYEDIICKPLRPTYDGSAEQLIPFLNRLDIRRQDEGWYPITFLHTNDGLLDIIRDFSKISEHTMTTAAHQRWTSINVATEKHTVDHPTYNSRVLARLLLGSVTDDFAITVINHLERSLRNDGPLILWTICNNIHRNHIAFTETIKQKIRATTIQHFNNDIPKYIIQLKDNLRLITTSTEEDQTHNDLITYIFQQLSECNITLFKEAVQKLYVEYLEAKHPDLTPMKLLKWADDKVQILRHANQWNDQHSSSVMALKVELERQQQGTKALVQQLVAHIGKISRSFETPKTPSKDNPYNYPSWMVEDPTSLSDTKQVNGRTHVWCVKCRQGKGLWVHTHNTSTHIDNFRRQRRQQQYNDTNLNNINNSFQPPQPNMPQKGTPVGIKPQAQLSLTDYIESYFSGVSDEHHDLDPSLHQST